MKNSLIISDTLRKVKFTGYGHWKISIEIDGETITHVTNNMPAFDSAFDEDEDDHQEARAGRTDEIMRKQDIEIYETNIED